MKEILFFNEIDKSMNPCVGGKGANLGEMTRAGFPVPFGFCLTTKVYDDFASGLELDGLSGADAREILKKCNLSDECLQKLQEALKEFSDDTLFSVRSSATAEDLPYASFAGQQDTYLNISKDNLPDAIKNCFVSLYTDRAVSYRMKNGIEKPSMSVVVQKMVKSDASGVMFTANPVNGRRTHLVIDAIFGLGEAIVSGLVSPDHIVYDKKNKKIESIELAKKEFAIVPISVGGTEKKMLNSKESVLTNEQIVALATLGEKLENHYNAPQDVEWAIEDGRLYILQTRAITSLYPAPEMNDNKFHFLFNMGYQQMNTAAMPKMALDCLLGVANLKKEDLMTFKPFLIYTVGQHMFVDFSMIFWAKPLRKIALKKLLPMMDPSAATAVEELFKRKEKFQHPNPAVFGIFKLAAKSFPKFLTSKDPKELSLKMAEKIKGRSDDIILDLQKHKGSPEMLRNIFVNTVVFNTFAKYFMPMLMSGILSLKKLEKIEKEMDCEGKWTTDMQIGNEGNLVTEMGLHIGDLADFVAKDDELRALLESETENIGALLSERDDNFGKCYKEFMEKYGFRGAGELDVSKPRWKENPEPIILQILATAKNKETGAHRREYEEKNQKAIVAGEAMISAVLEKYGKRKAEKVRKCVERFRYYYPYREHFKYYWMRNFGTIRQLLLEVGEEMAENGQIENRDDIMHLHLKEEYSALNNKEDLKELVKERKQEFERVSRLTPPRIITTEGEVLMGGIKREGLPENAFVGAGVSPGSVEGIAKVVLDPLNAVVEKGEILVAPFTDPGWTPLFVDAAAVVTEIGGALTHGAVVAREYGIPGVVGVTDATKILKTGQKILVDGTNGYILVLE